MRIKLINIFGCTDNLRDYALGYGYIISIGIPFSMIGTTLNSIKSKISVYLIISDIMMAK